jgi:hypothetical protein
MAFAEVTSFGAAIAGAEDNVDMQSGLALRIVGDVANQGSDFDLLADRNFLVVLLLPVEVEQDRIAQGADRGKARSVDIFALSELLKACDDLLAGFEHNHKGALPAGFMEQFVLHGGLQWTTNRSNPMQVPRIN